MEPAKGQASSESPGQSRRVYVWWGVGFAFLAVLAAFCWLVVTPILQVRAAIAPLPVVNYLAIFIPDEAADRAEAAVARLGGQRKAARKLALFIKAPAWVQSNQSDNAIFSIPEAPLRTKAVALLGRCGEPGVTVLAKMVEGPEGPLAYMAASSIILGGPEAKAWAIQHQAILQEVLDRRGHS